MPRLPENLPAGQLPATPLPHGAPVAVRLPLRGVRKGVPRQLHAARTLRGEARLREGIQVSDVSEGVWLQGLAEQALGGRTWGCELGE